MNMHDARLPIKDRVLLQTFKYCLAPSRGHACLSRSPWPLVTKRHYSSRILIFQFASRCMLKWYCNESGGSYDPCIVCKNSGPKFSSRSKNQTSDFSANEPGSYGHGKNHTESNMCTPPCVKRNMTGWFCNAPVLTVQFRYNQQCS